MGCVAPLKDLTNELGAQVKHAHHSYVLAKAPHRHDENPSFSLYLGAKNKRVMAHDFATGESWTLDKYLRTKLGYTDADVLSLQSRYPELYITDAINPEARPYRPSHRQAEYQPRSYAKPRPPMVVDEATMAKAIEALAQYGIGNPQYAIERGLEPLLYEGDILSDDHGNLIFPVYIFTPSPMLINGKIRYASNKGPRYSYLVGGLPGGYAFFGAEDHNEVVIVEGFTSAASVWLAIKVLGIKASVVGVSSANVPLDANLLAWVKQGNKTVYVLSDGDVSGMKGSALWIQQLLANNITPLVAKLDNLKRDANDILVSRVRHAPPGTKARANATLRYANEIYNMVFARSKPIGRRKTNKGPSIASHRKPNSSTRQAQLYTSTKKRHVRLLTDPVAWHWFANGYELIKTIAKGLRPMYGHVDYSLVESTLGYLYTTNPAFAAHVDYLIYGHQPGVLRNGLRRRLKKYKVPKDKQATLRYVLSVIALSLITKTQTILNLRDKIRKKIATERQKFYGYLARFLRLLPIPTPLKHIIADTS